jgi:hypothetical protein
MSPEDPRDLEMVARISRTARDHVPRPGVRFLRVEYEGSFPSTIVKVVFDVYGREKVREYPIWDPEFALSQTPDAIELAAYTDIVEEF